MSYTKLEGVFNTPEKYGYRYCTFYPYANVQVLCTVTSAHSLLSVSRKLNKNPLTIRLAMALGMQRQSRPSMYATTPDSRNLLTPLFKLIFPCFFSWEEETTISLPAPSAATDFPFHLVPAISLLACFRNIRMEKLTNRCSHKVSTVGPIFHSCTIFLFGSMRFINTKIHVKRVLLLQVGPTHGCFLRTLVCLWLAFGDLKYPRVYIQYPIVILSLKKKIYI